MFACFSHGYAPLRDLHSFPTRRSSDLVGGFVKLRSEGDDERTVLANADGELGFFMENGQLSQILTEALGLDIAETFGFLVEGDRKSTRLNSSHMSISYAVFCLKKKKKQ